MWNSIDSGVSGRSSYPALCNKINLDSSFARVWAMTLIRYDKHTEGLVEYFCCLSHKFTDFTNAQEIPVSPNNLLGHKQAD